MLFRLLGGLFSSVLCGLGHREERREERKKKKVWVQGFVVKNASLRLERTIISGRWGCRTACAMVPISVCGATHKVRSGEVPEGYSKILLCICRFSGHIDALTLNKYPFNALRKPISCSSRTR